jgi:hypothetical protein
MILSNGKRLNMIEGTSYTYSRPVKHVRANHPRKGLRPCGRRSANLRSSRLASFWATDRSILPASFLDNARAALVEISSRHRS